MSLPSMLKEEEEEEKSQILHAGLPEPLSNKWYKTSNPYMTREEKEEQQGNELKKSYGRIGERRSLQVKGKRPTKHTEG